MNAGRGDVEVHYIHTHVYVYTYLNIHIYIYIYKYIHMYIYVYICMYVHIYIYIYTYICDMYTFVCMVMCHVWITHVTRFNWGMPQLQISDDTRTDESYVTYYEWVVWYIWISHVTHMNESRHTYKCVFDWVRSHTYMRPTCEWVLPHTQKSHVSPMKLAEICRRSPAANF